MFIAVLTKNEFKSISWQGFNIIVAYVKIGEINKVSNFFWEITFFRLNSHLNGPLRMAYLEILLHRDKIKKSVLKIRY